MCREPGFWRRGTLGCSVAACFCFASNVAYAFSARTKTSARSQRDLVPEQVLHLAQEVVAGLVHAPLRQGGKHGRMAASDPRHLNALVCGVFREMQLADAEREHRRIARRRIEPAPLDLGDQRDLARGVSAVVGDTLLELADKVVVREASHRDALHERTPRRGRMVEGRSLDAILT